MNEPTTRIQQVEINNVLWRACDTFRGTIDASEYKNYILTMLFLKYISDVWADHYAKLREEYGDDDQRIRRRLERERFVLPQGTSYYDLYDARGEDDLGERINKALEAIEDANKTKLAGVFRNIDFNSEANLGRTKDRNGRLRKLLEDFADPRLDLSPMRIGNLDVIGNAYEYLIGKFAAGAGKKAGEFYTPPEVSELLAELVNPQPGDRICDPTCGSGSLLIRAGDQLRKRGVTNFRLLGQEANGSTWALAKMNMFLHDVDGARIEWGDTIREPKLLEDDQLMKFEVVVANPPFSLDKWGADDVEGDPYKRFWRGVPPKDKGDFAFISHMIETTTSDGRVGVVVPHGALFRGGSEGQIRQQLIDENLVDAIVGLPVNLFYGTGIPAVIMVLKKSKDDNSIVFIDASREFESNKSKNRLRADGIEKIVSAYISRSNIEGFCEVANTTVVKENNYNLTINKYVSVLEEVVDYDILEIEGEILELESQLNTIRQNIKTVLKELEHGN
ncbi:type I restriction-modification system subunit M [Deinococcus seoulensis]|uniref:site-specific DNA-methyltransferase (adenine-specific) n=1 Tax=Deinococcus seoulensis TaxID=1837379 RepID=A0ABQ2RSM0_9DEIO|nr:type I restriction-modification system subunit M [Deinococcus seoulensis]GGR61575.1 type I restriction-modification system subunit M [Deinococcus seoulensis]